MEEISFKERVKSSYAWAKGAVEGETFGWQRKAGGYIGAARLDFAAGITHDVAGGKAWQAFGGAAHYANRQTVRAANAISQAAGSTQRFSTIGSVMAKAPIKGLAKQWAMGLPILYGMETMFGGKQHGLGTLVSSAWNDIPFTLGMTLAGGGMKGIVKHGIWQVAGESLGLGPWGSFGLQLLGSTAFKGAAPLALGVMAGHGIAKGLYSMHQMAYQAGKTANRGEFVTGDLSLASSESATMRSRAVAAIQKSHMNMRSMLGNEAAYMMGR